MKIVAGYCTHQGQRRERNEDSLVVDEALALFAVADGMGGHRGGEVASTTAVEALRAAVANQRAISEAVMDANRAVFERAAGRPELQGMGTTLTAAVVVEPDSLLLGHVGDSRAYLLRDGELSRITEDHSLVEELVREGRITAEQAEVHPQRNIVTRALGIDREVAADVYAVPVRSGDRVLLCSDGLTNMVREREIGRIATEAADPEDVANQLVDAANAAGGDDNITVVVLDISEVPPAAAQSAVVADPDALLVTRANPVAVDVPAAEPVAAAPKVPRAPLGRRLLGAALWVLPVLVVLGVAFGTLRWYAGNAYFVSTDAGMVVIKQGRPGGLLMWDPEVEIRTSIAVRDLPQADRSDLADGVAAEGSLATARAYVRRLEDRLADATTTSSTTTTSTPSSTTTTGRTPGTTRTSKPARGPSTSTTVRPANAAPNGT